MKSRPIAICLRLDVDSFLDEEAGNINQIVTFVMIPNQMKNVPIFFRLGIHVDSLYVDQETDDIN